MREETSDVQRSHEADALRAAYGREGCPICLVVLEYVEHAMDGWEFEGFTNARKRYSNSLLFIGSLFIHPIRYLEALITFVVHIIEFSKALCI